MYGATEASGTRSAAPSRVPAATGRAVQPSGHTGSPSPVSPPQCAPVRSTAGWSRWARPANRAPANVAAAPKRA
ncbi:hypothetical protein LUX57_48595 [Actinomadura madurae]|uniref:hypothetical protein n=1 Tax=Actinomadura madurae TaxID=1993 RepID=UPI0020D20865|nr:hypothetical protein [Actinomadura madurae]MCP9971977.1 hypothetical protein [Actinomadura madurae]